MSDTLRILYTALIAIPFLGVAAFFESLFNGGEAGIFSMLASVAILIVLCCIAILGYEFIIEIWSNNV